MLKTFFRLTYRTVANWLRDKLNLPPERYQEIDKEQHDHAFTMAGIDSLQALSRLNERVQAFIAEGRTLAEFRADFEKIANEEGLTYTGSASWRSKLVALTNARDAYGAGRYQQQTTPEMLRDRPYWQYRHGGSAEPRVLHLGWNGTVLPANSYWWQTHYAPNGYGCFPEGTLVATPEGWRLIESIEEGDLVIGGSGDIKPVTVKYRRPYSGDLIRVEIENGLADLLTPNHRVLTMRGWIAAGSLQLSDVLIQCTQAAGLNQVISDVDNLQPVTNLDMPLPGQGNAAIVKALNTQVKFRQENVYPLGIVRRVVNNLKAKTLKMIHESLFDLGGSNFSIDVHQRVGPMTFNFCGSHLGSNFGALGGSSSLQPFSHKPHSFTVFFGFARSGMTSFCRLPQNLLSSAFRLFFPPLVVSSPLQSNRNTSCSLLNSVPVNQSLKSPKIDSPLVTNQVGEHSFLDIPQPEGFVNGAPLDQFDCIDNFVAWARSHSVTRKVLSINKVYYTNTVYNLEVKDDESFCVQIAIAHNCSCKIFTLSAADLERMGKDTLDVPPQNGFYNYTDPVTKQSRLIPMGIDPGFDHIPGQKDRKRLYLELLGKLPDELRKFGEGLING